MKNSSEIKLLVDELRELIVADCCKQLSNVQNCGMLIDVYEYETLVTGFAIISNDKKESWLVEDMQILDKAEILQEKMNKEWASMFLVINLGNNKFSTEYYIKETSWRKDLFDHVGEWTHYTKMVEKL